MAVIYAIAASIANVAPASAQGLPLIRDTEIENLLKEYSMPIFKAAGLASQNVSMRIIKHESFNAFVVDGRNVFINTGTLTQAKTPNEVIGVIAHETGHIMGGHMAALRSRIARDATKNLLLTALGIGLMVGGAVAGGDTAREIGSAGSGLAMGGSEMVMRSILSERRSQESAADQAGLRLLEATHQSGRGMLKDVRAFRRAGVLVGQGPRSVRAQPSRRCRRGSASCARTVAASPYADARDPPQLQLRHDMMRAKLDGHMLPAAAGLQPLSRQQHRSAGALRPRHRPQLLGQLRPGHARDRRPHPRPAGQPVFLGVQGRVVSEGRPAGGGHRAAAAGRRPPREAEAREPWLSTSQAQIMLGRAMVSTNDPRYLDEAIALLTNVLGADKPLWQGEDDDWLGWWQLAVAYERKGNQAEAMLATARKLFYSGNAKDIREAQVFAKRAQQIFTRGSRGWLIAEDIVTYKIPT